jgi:hypothetical protein
MLPGGSSAQNVEARDRQIVRCVSVSSHLRAATSPCAASALSRPHRRATRSVSTRPNAPRPLSGVGPSEHPNEDEADCEGAEDDQHKSERTGHVGLRIGRSGRGVPSPLGTSGPGSHPAPIRSGRLPPGGRTSEAGQLGLARENSRWRSSRRVAIGYERSATVASPATCRVPSPTRCWMTSALMTPGGGPAS